VRRCALNQERFIADYIHGFAYEKIQSFFNR
jgi:hypothetical protein